MQNKFLPHRLLNLFAEVVLDVEPNVIHTKKELTQKFLDYLKENIHTRGGTVYTIDFELLKRRLYILQEKEELLIGNRPMPKTILDMILDNTTEQEVVELVEDAVRCVNDNFENVRCAEKMEELIKKRHETTIL
jgi:hypothetical protein